MAEHVFESALVEEFYNTCHGPDGRFCSGAKLKGGLKGKGSAGATKGYGSGKTDPKALSVTQKYGTRQASTGTKAKAAAPKGSASKKSGGTSGSKYTADKYGSGRTDPAAMAVTSRFGTRGARPKPKAKSSNIKYKNDPNGSGKTDPAAKKWTEKYGTRRG